MAIRRLDAARQILSSSYFSSSRCCDFCIESRFRFRNRILTFDDFLLKFSLTLFWWLHHLLTFFNDRTFSFCILTNYPCFIWMFCSTSFLSQECFQKTRVEDCPFSIPNSRIVWQNACCFLLFFSIFAPKKLAFFVVLFEYSYNVIVAWHSHFKYP